jgi:prepilin-type N-terminal cleavage/methylation domain-containing protein
MKTHTPRNRGFTIIEMVIALVVGLVILSASLQFAVATMRTVEGGKIREETYRNVRFITMSLERDFQFTGVSLQSSTAFGSLTVSGDTVMILSVPYEPNEAAPYDLYPPPGTNNPLPIGGTCGATCIDLLEDANGDFDLHVGDLARLQVNGERRLILVQSVTNAGPSVALWFTNASKIFKYTAGLTGDLRLDRYGTFVQKLAPIVYYVEGTQLMRAERFNLDGSLVGVPLADGIHAWDVQLEFEDGDLADNAVPNDADYTNDYDDIVAVHVTATVAADNTDPRVNGGQLFTRTYEWRFSPRNLMYERNR